MYDDESFLLAFESCALPPETFDHRAHIRVAFLYLSRLPFLEACIAMRNSLQRYAAHIGRAGLYHETITVAYVSILSQRMADAPGLDWAALIAANPDLLDRTLLMRYYTAEALAANDARQRFVLAQRESLHA